MVFQPISPDRLVFTDQSDNTLLIIDFQLNLLMTSAKIKETSVTFNDKIPSQDYSHPGDGTKWSISAFSGIEVNFRKKDDKRNQSLRLDNLVLTNESIIYVGHREEFQKLTLRVLALNQSEYSKVGFSLTKGYRSKHQL